MAKGTGRVMVTKTQRPTNHLLHLVMTVLTCGLWLPVWYVTTVRNKHSSVKSYTTYPD